MNVSPLASMTMNGFLFLSIACSTGVLEGGNTVKVDHPVKQFKGVLFEKILGQEARLKPSDPIKECKVSATDPRIQKDLIDLAKLIEAASKEPWQDGFHIVAQIPSVEIYATLVTTDSKEGVKTERLLLVKDYQTIKTRNGKATDQLLEKINELCP